MEQIPINSATTLFVSGLSSEELLQNRLSTRQLNSLMEEVSDQLLHLYREHHYDTLLATLADGFNRIASMAILSLMAQGIPLCLKIILPEVSTQRFRLHTVTHVQEFYAYSTLMMPDQASTMQQSVAYGLSCASLLLCYYEPSHPVYERLRRELSSEQQLLNLYPLANDDRMGDQL